MKAEHRKELQTNALADRIGRFFKGVRTRKAPGSLKIWLIAILLVAGVAGTWWYLSKVAANNRSARWVGVAEATDEAQLKSEDALKKAEQKLNAIIEKNPGTRAAMMARFRRAQLHLRVMGLDQLVTSAAPANFRGMPEPNKKPEINKKALDSIKEASDEYERLAEECKDDPFWGPQALLGAAKAAEAQAVQDLKRLDDAADLYAKVARAYPDSAAGQEAKARSDELKDPAKRKEIENFYRKLASG